MYNCEIPGCNNKVTIRSTIKKGEHKGLKACGFCKSKFDGKSLKPFNEKRREKRKKEREDLPDFFQDSIEELKDKPVCANCGCSINVNYLPHTNIAHILPKSRYKSVMSNKYNFILLCSFKDNEDGSSCHYHFDNNINDIPLMPCFKEAKRKFNLFKDEVKEKGKILDIFNNN